MTIPLPSAMERATVTWTLGHADTTGPLDGARGRVRFEATAVAVAYSDRTVLPKPVETPIIAGVMTPVDLIVNDPDVWNWKVQVRVGVDWEPFHINVEPGGTNLASAAPTPGKGPVRVLKGDQGAQGASLASLEQITDDTLRGEIHDPLTGETTTLTYVLPRGPEGPYGGTEVTDPQVASYIKTETATKTALDQAYVRGVNARAYGAVGDGSTDDTAALQTAINTASTFGVETKIPDGRYRLTGSLTIPTGADLRLAPGAILDVSEVPAAVPALSAAGSSGASVPLTADAAKRSTTAIVHDASSISAGDWIKIASARPYGDTGQPIGEIQRVRAVNGNTLTLEDRLHSDYLIADNADVVRIQFRENITISGGHMVGDPTEPILHRGVVLDMVRNVAVTGMSFQWIHYVGVWVLDSVGISILGCSFDEALADGYGYGVMGTWAVQDMSVSACHGMKVRHLVTLGGGATRRGIARRIAVTGCTASQCFDAALDSHPSAEDIAFVGNTITGSRQDGIVAQGGRFVISGNTVTGSVRHGIFVQVRSLGGLGGTITGNTIHGSGATGVQVSFQPGVEWRVWNGLTVAGNAITDSGTHGVAVSNADTTFQVEALAITGNTVRRSVRHGMHLRGAKDCTVGSNHIGQSGEEGILLQNCPDSAVTGNSVAGSGLRAYRLVASPGVTVNGNRGAAASVGLMTDATSAPVIAMGNSFAGCTTRTDLGGTGNVSSSADAAGAYNL